MTPAPLPVASPVPNRPTRGRPKKPRTSVVNVRLPDHIYDLYIKTASRNADDVRTIMRNVLTYYAPRV